MQFSFYADNIIARIEMQTEAFSKNKNVPKTLFDVYARQKSGLEKLKEKFGAIITPDQLSSV